MKNTYLAMDKVTTQYKVLVIDYFWQYNSCFLYLGLKDYVKNFYNL